ncbi:MAG: hypothetical protein AAF614_28560 [Chloroflexota bacterium]
MSQHHIWEERWAVLKAVIEDVISDLDPKKEQKFRRQQTLYWLLQSLKAFADDQISFFTQGFNPDNETFQLQPSEDYPEDFVFRTTLDQVGNDLALIQQIIQQRCENRDVTINNKPIRLNDRLHQADQLAQLALEPAMKRKMVGKTAVITYFHKSPSIRVLPYAPVALIAIPYTSISNDRDLLAIPHEVGHYIYRHGHSLRHKLEQRIPRRPAWRRRWLEEIFSDVYGALIAGPVLALSFQELLMAKPVEHFIHDHGTHPVPFLRPFIYHTVLKKMGYEFGDVVKELEEHWEEARQTRGVPESFIPEDAHDQDVVSEREAQRYLKEAIAVMMGQVPNGHEPWFSYSQEQAAASEKSTDMIERLYTNFEQVVVKLTSKSAKKKVVLNELFAEKVTEGRSQTRDSVPSLAPALVVDSGPMNRPPMTDALLSTGGTPLNGSAMTKQSRFATRENLVVSKTALREAPANGKGTPKNVRRLGTTGTWIDQVKVVTVGNTPRCCEKREVMINTLTSYPVFIPPHLWTAILSTDGWNTGGPENDSFVKH